MPLQCVSKRKGTIHVVCKYCRTSSYTHPNKVGSNKQGKGGTTRSLSRHLSECDPYKKQKPNVQFSIADFTTSTNSKALEDDLLTKVLKFLISGNIAFNQADNPFFQAILREIPSENRQIVNRKNLREKLTKVASDAKEDLMLSLVENESKISLALDCWTSRNGYAFLGKSPFLFRHSNDSYYRS